MTETKETIALIIQLRKTLQSWSRGAHAVAADSNVLHWQKVNIESFTSVLENLGLSATALRQARDEYPDLVAKTQQRVTFLSNELLNLESDIKLGPLPPEAALAAALKIDDQCKEFKPDIALLINYHKTMAAGSKTLKENLNFRSFIPQARMQAGGKNKSLFETGYTIYLTVSDEPDIEHEENVTNMFSFLNKAIKLHEAITQTPLPTTLPPIITSFLDHQRDLCLEGCKQIRLFVNFVSAYFQSEMDYIKSFQANLDRLKGQPLTELLLEIHSQIDAAGNCVQAFSHKKFLLEDIQKTDSLLTNIETFHQLLVSDFIPYLEGQVDKKNGILNPRTLAAVRSRKYFSGLSGLWRFVRMLLLSMNINTLISTDVLEDKIAEAIGSAALFFKSDAPDNEKISDFIESFFVDYKRPFPHDELVAITRKSLVTYATILDKVFAKYKPRKLVLDAEDQDVVALGRLSAKIEIRTDTLMKYREKFEF